MVDYFAYVHKDRASDFGVSFPDFPGCVAAGRTLAEAQALAPEVLALHIAAMIEDGVAVPKASELDALAADPARAGAVVIVVSVKEPDGRTVR